jgi:hypothetical protein
MFKQYMNENEIANMTMFLEHAKQETIKQEVVDVLELSYFILHTLFIHKISTF